MTAATGMFEQYVHMLIPTDSGFSATAEQVIDFLNGMSAIGASPLGSKLTVMKPSGRVRCFTDPLTGEKKSFPAHDRIALESSAELLSAIGTHQEYSVAVDGRGPTKTPPFPLYVNGALFTENYGFALRCCLRSDAVSIYDPYGGGQSGDGGFRHPVSGNAIEAAGPERARFWVEFEFGKWLLPKIEESLELVDPNRLDSGEILWAGLHAGVSSALILPSSNGDDFVYPFFKSYSFKEA